MVIATVSRPEQAEIAKVAGADYIINYKHEDVVQRIRELTGTECGVDRIVDVNFAANVAIADATLNINCVLALYAGNPGEICVRMEAAALNYLDLLVVKGQLNPHLRLPYIPVAFITSINRLDPEDTDES
jgi:NADPH:quinone reductase-like Zn-dependent oxidoreductase